MLLPSVPTSSHMPVGKLNEVRATMPLVPRHLYSHQLPLKRWQSLGPPIARPVHLPRAAQTIGAADNSDDRSKITSIFHVFSDPKCNRRLLALAIGQMLCSVATLIHDSYLPVYVQDELGLSNTKVSHLHVVMIRQHSSCMLCAWLAVLAAIPDIVWAMAISSHACKSWC